MKKSIFVLVRFSVLNIHSKGWEISNLSYDNYKKELYSDERLSAKIKFFGDITLASLDSQIDKRDSDIKVYLVAGIDMPTKYKGQLEDFKRNRPWLYVEYVAEEVKNIFSFFDNVVEELEDDSIYATVRLDDDDALSSEYFARLNQYLTLENVNKVVSFTNGIAAFWDQDLGYYSGLYTYQYPLIALGMAAIHKKGLSNFSNVYNLGSHTKVDQRADVIYDASEAMFIRTFHQSSDSYHKQSKAILKIKKAQIVGYDVLSKHYPNLNSFFARYVGNSNGIYKIPLNKDNFLEFNLSGVERLERRIERYILVIFTAAVSNRVNKQGPFFSGNNIARGLDLPLLSFADPLVSDTNLPLAWYLGGNDYPNVQHAIANVIDYYMSKYNAKAILLGGSGGGFASLAIASMMKKNVTVLAMNPQTDIFQYHPKAYKNYLSYAFKGSESIPIKEQKSLLLRNYIKYYVNATNVNSGDSIYYVQNMKDDFHVKNHFYPYLQSFLSNFNKACNEVNFVLNDFGEGHVAPTVSWIQNFLKNNILDRGVQSHLKAHRFRLLNLEINLLICDAYIIISTEDSISSFDYISMYIVKDGKIRSHMPIIKNIMINESPFDACADLSSYCVNIFVCKDGNKTSKSFSLT